jgi:hypothetical protein
MTIVGGSTSTEIQGPCRLPIAAMRNLVGDRSTTTLNRVTEPR